MGFLWMQPIGAANGPCHRPMLLSQFPFWDFFECNSQVSSKYSKPSTNTSLNSLSGISLNATCFWEFLCKETNDFTSLNSLSGISLNATDAVSAVFRGIGGENQRALPLTPLL
jgi:hypothetical protein